MFYAASPLHIKVVCVDQVETFASVQKLLGWSHGVALDSSATNKSSH